MTAKPLDLRAVPCKPHHLIACVECTRTQELDLAPLDGHTPPTEWETQTPYRIKWMSAVCEGISPERLEAMGPKAILGLLCQNEMLLAECKRLAEAMIAQEIRAERAELDCKRQRQRIAILELDGGRVLAAEFARNEIDRQREQIARLREALELIVSNHPQAGGPIPEAQLDWARAALKESAK